MPIRLSYSREERTTVKKFYNDKARFVTVYLGDEGEPTGIHCMYCKKKLFECQHAIAQVVAGIPPAEIKNLKIKCKNPGCATYYYFVSVV